ncbi:MAG: hypothetical protein KC550_00750 [Nanoarchaeota archaeon]|nr:hypothetical protein [Nanoarchaeota archaeon]
MRNKKGIQNHVLVLLGVSFAMSFFLIFVLTGVFRTDPVTCESVNFDITHKCKADGLYFITIQNNDRVKSLTFLMNDVKDDKYFISIGNSASFRWEKEDNYVILPYIRGETDGECRGKRVKIDTRTIVGLC